MRRSAASIRVSTIRNVPKLPNCPEDLSQAQYVTLVYSEHCSTCEASAIEPMDPYLNVRSCNLYRAGQVASIKKAPNRLVKTLVPQTSENDDSEPVCLSSNLEKLTSYVLRLEDPDDPAHLDGETWIQIKGDFKVARVKYA
ncbi:hypothetical protein FRC12_016956 [Ceratobasidium sp. 428]|nr:hypothetical protein FRC12_016956 [Ceratobasidium sp. 428]